MNYNYKCKKDLFYKKLDLFISLQCVRRLSHVRIEVRFRYFYRKQNNFLFGKFVSSMTNVKGILYIIIIIIIVYNN